MNTQIRIAVLALSVVLLGIGTRAALAGEGPPDIQVHGYMQNRFYSAPGANLQFRSERISISTLAALPNNSNGYVEVYYHPWAPASGLYLESAYFETALGPGRIRAGRGRRMTFGITPYYGSRRTSNYGVVSEAFTQDRIQGVQYMVQQDVLDAGLSVHTAYRLGARLLGEVPGDAPRNAGHGVPHLALRDLTGTLSDDLQVSGRIGARWVDGPNGLRAGLSASWGGLDNADLANLRTSAAANPLTPGATPALGPGFSGTTQVQWGPDFTYRHPSGLLVQGELYFAELSDLGFAAGNLLAGCEMTNGWKAFVRYAQKEMHTARTANPLSWDAQQLSLSVVQPLRKGLWMQYEFEKNTERTNNGKVDNDVFFAELFTGF